MYSTEKAKREVFWKLLFIAVLGGYVAAYGQDKSQADYKAAHCESEVINGESCIRLQDDVVFNLDQVTILAKNALYYTKNKLIEAQGDVKIIHKDGSTVTADHLTYEEVSHLAKLHHHVVCTSDEKTFYTDHLDYDVQTRQGHFWQGGRLVDGDNVLTSLAGCYDGKDQAITLTQQVELVSPDYTLQCDTLHYNTTTKMAQFAGTTKITSRDEQQTLMTDEGGEYDLRRQQGTIAHGTIKTASYEISSDLFRIEKEKEVYTASGHVKVSRKEDNVTILGDYGQYQREQETAEVYGNPLMTKQLEQDLLYLSADTFVMATNEDSSRNHEVHAYHNVKIYKEDLQGKADSLIYQMADATLYFYGDPIFWSKKSQLSADTVRVLLREKTLDQMQMSTNAFVASEDDLGNFNQVQGRDMVAYFKKNMIDHIEIDGNAESLYFVLDAKGNLQGMNHIKCGHIRINMEAGSVFDIAFELDPMGAFYPPHKISEKYKKLDNFRWRIYECPTRQEIVEPYYDSCLGQEQ